ncbi:hypothetical protein HK096_005756 [Nowakowskiella sp. JEL0078]|nr:hypothetical protein HK096_005756 [Nowakowskiella sp. JEL0078]
MSTPERKQSRSEKTVSFIKGLFRKDSSSSSSSNPPKTVVAKTVTEEPRALEPVVESASKKVKIAVVIYSTYGHIEKVQLLSESIAKGAEEAGAEVKIFKVPETLSKEVLELLHAKSWSIDLMALQVDLPEITPEILAEYDGFLFGLPTRYGAAPAQVKAFWDSTGGLWSKGALVGKYGGIFTSTATQHGGQETTPFTFITHYAHHGINFVPIGFSTPLLFDNSEVLGGSPWGAGTIANGDGSRQPHEKELAIAEHQGKHFTNIVIKATQ